MATPLKIPVIVEKVIKHTDTVCSYIFKPLKQCPMFKPGQFLHLAIDQYDPSFQWPESRVFSIANSPTRREKIKITFAVKGKFTKRMYDEIKENNIIWLKLPYGSFTFNGDDKNIVLIAGGTGITPFLSFLEFAIDNNLKANIKLYYGVRSENLLLFENILLECKKKLSYFNETIFIEHTLEKRNSYMVGTLDITQIFNETKNIKNYSYYLSGPLEMVNYFKSYLLKKNINEVRITIDEW